MTTTNFEISKKLAEIGFKPKNEESQVWNYDGQIRWKYPAYEFETLFDALPDSITREYKSTEDGTIKEFEEKLVITKNNIYYNCYDIQTEDDANEYWREYGYYTKFSEVVKNWEGESLADTAGRMIIKLYEAGIINFNK